MSDAIYIVLASIGGILGLFTLVGRYLLARLQQLEQRDEATDKAVLEERNQLRQRVADLEARDEAKRKQIDELSRQVARVPVLENQIDSLTKTLESNQLRLDKAEDTAKKKQSEIDQLLEQCQERDRVIAKLEMQLREREIESRTYQHALALVRGEPTEHAETKAAAAAPEPGEGAGTQED